MLFTIYYENGCAIPMERLWYRKVTSPPDENLGCGVHARMPPAFSCVGPVANCIM